MNSPFHIKTQRLIIRKPQDHEYVHYENCLRDPEIMKHQGGVMPEEQIQTSVAEMKKHWDKHGFGRALVFLKDSDECVGIVSLKYLSEDNPVPDLGYMIWPIWQGQGYATEASQAVLNYAFEKLGFKKVCATTYSENEKGIYLLKKLGFHKVRDQEIIYRGRNYGTAEVWEISKSS